MFTQLDCHTHEHHQRVFKHVNELHTGMQNLSLTFVQCYCQSYGTVIWLKA